MTWPPILSAADPADAWFAEPELAQIRRAEAIDRAIAGRDAFEEAVARLDNPTPEAIAVLWTEIDKETQP